MISFTDALSAARRKALLTGQPLADNELKGIQSGWFNNASAMSAKERAQQLAEAKLLEDRLATANQMEAAKIGQYHQTVSNLANNAVQTLGMDAIKAEPGKSLISKGWDIGKEGVNAIGEATGLVSKGVSSVPNFSGQTFTSIFNAAEPGAQSMGLATEAAIPETIPGVIESTVAPEIGAGVAAEGSLLGTIGTAAAGAAPYAAAGKLATKYGGNFLTELGEKNDFKPAQQMGRTISKAADMEGVGYQWAQELMPEQFGEGTTAHKVKDVTNYILNPAAAIVKNLGCIIVTACTSRDSYEVNVARQYRDNFLDQDQLRGYYCLAEKIVPMLTRKDKMRKAVKKYLVDRLVDYGEYRLGLKEKKPRILSCIVATVFLATIKTIGAIIPQYTRINGEVY
jgi:DNA-binding protein